MEMTMKGWTTPNRRKARDEQKRRELVKEYYALVGRPTLTEAETKRLAAIIKRLGY
jgi:hypothetical protein